MSDGSVYRWQGRRLESVHMLRGSKKPVFSICVVAERVVTASKGGIIRVWNELMTDEVRALDLAEAVGDIVDEAGRSMMLADVDMCIKSLDFLDDKCMVGTKNSQILEVEGLLGDKRLDVSLVLLGHGPSGSYQGKRADSQGELW